MLFALVAGAATALSPCVLPVLPAVLGAGVTGGRRRPLGVVTGLVAAFTFATVALVYVIDALGLPDDLVRTLAIVTLLVFGISLLVPRLGDRIEAWGSRIAPAPARLGGDGFGSGLLLGASLGLVYTPCAGPILAGVITVSAAQDFTAGKLAVALSYAVGSGLVLYALMLRRPPGRRPAQPYRAWVQAAMGAAMVAVALAMIAELDLEFQNAIADDLPSVLVNPSGELEESEAVADDLAAIRGGHGAVGGGSAGGRGGREAPRATARRPSSSIRASGSTPRTASRSRSPELGAADRVVLIDFWTYTCINCIRTLPYLKAWDAEYRDDGLTIVGVHAPEFAFEKDAGNVADAIERPGSRVPGGPGQRARHLGRLREPVLAGEVPDRRRRRGPLRPLRRGLLRGDRGRDPLAARRGGRPSARRPGQRQDRTHRSRAAHARDLPRLRARAGLRRAAAARRPRLRACRPWPLRLNEFAYGGRWRVDSESGTALEQADAEALVPGAARLPACSAPSTTAGEVEVLLDGEPISDAAAGEDVRGGRVQVDGQRLYRLVDLPQAGRHTLELRFEPGISGYAFTFG